MLPARALFYAILISLLLAVITSIMLLASYNQHSLINYYDTKSRLVDNCQSGIELLMSTTTDSISNTVIDLYQQKKDSVSLAQKTWGLLEVGHVSSWSGQDTIKRSFLIGKKPKEYALQLAESTSSLKVCGSTKIIGTAYVPREGVERGNIAGKYYENSKVVFGKIELVKIQNQDFLINRFLEIYKLFHAYSTNVMESDSIFNSFSSPVQIFSSDYWHTSNLYLSGNIVLVATEQVTIKANSSLQDILIIAPVITIESGFEGSIQAYAMDSLIIAPNVHLTYPSIVGLLPNQEQNTFSPILNIKENSTVDGAVVYSSAVYQNFEPIVTIESNAKVTGQVWVHGQLQHKGTIIGSTYCRKLFLKTPSAVYQNYLLDAVLDYPSLPKNYLIPSLFHSTVQQRSIIKNLE